MSRIRSKQEISSIINLLRVYFKSYYRHPDDPLHVPSIEKREIAYQPLGKETMVRHLAFRDLDSLRKFLVESVPAHVYYSTAYYADPDNPDMEKKGWEGADLVFDIDADHLNTSSCKTSTEQGILTVECLEDALKETLKLVDIIEEELGFRKTEYYIVFSGHRGFHVHIESETVRKLTQDERREILDYLLARAFKIDRFIDEKQRLLIAPGLEGLGRRVWNIIELLVNDEDLKRRAAHFKRILKRQLKKLTELNDKIAEMLKIHVDEVVTLDIKRLIRVPNSLHGKTGLRVTLLSKQDLERGAEFVIERSIPRILAKGRLKIVLRRKIETSNVLGVELDLASEEGTVSVPPYVGIYLIRQGIAELAE